jgi:hypothetical protein
MVANVSMDLYHVSYIRTEDYVKVWICNQNFVNKPHAL